MSGNINYRHKRTTTANKRPLPGALQEGEIVLNIESNEPGAFLKTNTNTLVKLGPASISASPPTLEGTGTLTYSKGELWYDTGIEILKVYDGSTWKNAFSGVAIYDSPDPPATPSNGDLWYDNDLSDLYIYIETPAEAWINIGSGSGSGGIASVGDDEPTGPINGQIWYETGTGFLYVYDAGDAQFEKVGGGTITTVDAVYAPGWSSDPTNAPTRSTIYDLFNGDTAAIAPDWDFGATSDLDFTSSSVDLNTGTTLTANTGSAVTLATGSTMTANSGSDIDAENADNVTVPTRSKVILGGEFTTDAASQAWVYQHLPIDNMNVRMTPLSNDAFLGGSLGTNVTSTELFVVPYQGRTIWLYNTVDTRWEPYDLSSQITHAMTMTAGDGYDVYIYDNAGTLELEFVVWTNYAARSVSLTQQDGVLVKTGEPNKRYLGLVGCTGTPNQTSVALGGFNVDNANIGSLILNQYNRLEAFAYNDSVTPVSSTAPANLTPMNFGAMRGVFGMIEGIGHVGENHARAIFIPTTTNQTVDFRIREHDRITATSTNQTFTYTHTASVSPVIDGISTSSTTRTNGWLNIYPTIHVTGGTLNNITCSMSSKFVW